MIKLSSIRHESRRGEVSYVLPGGVHTKSEFKALNALDDLFNGGGTIVEEVVAQVGKVTGVDIIRSNNAAPHKFLGV